MSDVQLCCGECGILFMVPQNWLAERKNDKRTWYCPNGHPRVFRESDLDRARRERDRALQEKARLESELAAQKALTAAAVAREKRAKKRTAAGVCPCCTRSFANMARHIRTKHPDYRKKALQDIRDAQQQDEEEFMK